MCATVGIYFTKFSKMFKISSKFDVLGKIKTHINLLLSQDQKYILKNI